jgi:phage gp37-like protein
MHEFESIENAALTALAPLRESGLRNLDVLAGQMDDETLEKVSLLFPFVYVKAANLKSKTENTADRIDVDLVVFVGDRNLRGGAAATKGDAHSPGVYSLLELAKKRLHRVRILPGWTPPLRQGEEEVYYDPKNKFCVYQAWYTLKKQE